MADNNFKSGPGGRLKAAAANLNKPTTQDSLDLYNNALAVENFYKKSKLPYKHQDYTTTPYGKNVLKNPFLELDDINDNYNQLLKIRPAQDVIKNNISQTLSGLNKIPAYRKEIDKNKFYQRELSHGNINIDAPMALYDRRIKPTIFSYYKDDSPFINDDVEIFKYDPIAVKPVSMLTPKERIEREKKYGKIPSSIPKPQPKPIQVIKRTVSEDVEPMGSRQAPVPSIMPSEMVAPVPRPVDVPPAPSMKEPVIEEETVVTERPVARKPPKAVMPRRAGGWSNQPLLMRLFPKLYER